jgi:hypothetical protein
VGSSSRTPFETQVLGAPVAQVIFHLLAAPTRQIDESRPCGGPVKATLAQRAIQVEPQQKSVDGLYPYHRAALLSNIASSM